MDNDRSGIEGGYDGPVVVAKDSAEQGGTRWIWVANGTSSTMFRPPLVRRPAPPPPPAGFSADRIIESFRAEAFGEEDPFLDALEDEAEVATEELGTSDQESADADGPIERAEIRVLGPVQTDGWRSAPARAIVLELACYLALHRERPVSGEGLRLALRPDGSKEQSAKTLRTYLSMLRKALGPEALPVRPAGGYQLAESITSDWERFVALSRSGALEDDLEALSLIRGRPFDGVPSGTYTWVFSEFLVSDMEVAIASVLTRAVGTLVEAADYETAITALRQGLRAVAGDYGLWELYLSVATQVGPAALSRARSEARAALGGDIPLG